ncbi:hypothetical protein Tco_1483806 [Tanacetum coccineum]
MFVFFVNTLLHNTMAEQNVPIQPPTRTDEQIISVDILSNTNFFQAFTTSASVPAIYLQQFWNTMKYNEKTRVYSCQVDEQWFDLSADLLRKALAITPINPTHPFELPSSGNTVIDFVNELGYPEPCLTGKTSGSDNPRHPVLQKLWGIITQTNVNHAELLWEEFTQGIQIFFSYKASHKASLKDPKKKVTPLLIPYGWFSKVIIYYLASNNNIHRYPNSAVHHTGDDFILGNLKFVPKESVHQEEGDDPDLEMAKKMSLVTHQEKGEGEGDDADMERAIKLSLDPAFLPQGRAPVGGVTIRDPVSKTTPKLPKILGKGKAIVTEEQVAHSLIDLSKKKRTTDQFILVRRDQAPHNSITGPSSQPEEDTSEKVIHKSLSTSDSERTESETEAATPKGDKDQGEVDSSTITSGVSIPVSTQGQARSDPEKAHEALAGPDPEPMQEDQTGSDSGKVHVSLVGPNPEHMDDEFLATAYPKVHENLKLITD